MSGPAGLNETRSIRLVDGYDGATVTVTTANHFDDSVFASRDVYELRRNSDGTYRLETARWSQACQPGRGHQDFAAELCI